MKFKFKIFVCLFTVFILLVFTVIPCFAYIPIVDNVVYINQAINQNFVSATFDGVGGYSDATYTSLTSAPSDMGTNDIDYVSKPIYYIPVNRIRTDLVSIHFDISELISDIAPFKEGYYRFRFGVYSRPNCNMEAIISATTADGPMEDVGRANGTYFGTGSNVRGTYYYFDIVFLFDDSYVDLDLFLEFTPLDGESDFLYTGTDPLYNNSFVSFTGFDAVEWKVTNIAPYPVGTILGEYATNDTYIYLDKAPTQVVSTFYIPELGISYPTNHYSATALIVIPNSDYVYVYVPSTSSYGYLYRALIIDSYTANQIGLPVSYTQFQAGYLQGVESLKTEIDRINLEWQKKYDQLIASKGNDQSYWYNKGYTVGYDAYIRNSSNLDHIIDSSSNGMRIFLSAFNSYTIFGVSLSTIIVGFVSIVLAYALYRKFSR